MNTADKTQKRMVDCDDRLIEVVLDAATSVHCELGPGLLESVYEKALMIELNNVGLIAECQVPIDVEYHGQNLGVGFRADIYC
jgi:GxxExxY protein